MDLLTSTGVDNNVEFMENNIVIVIMKSVIASQRRIPCHFITSLLAVHHSRIVTTRRTNSSGHMAKGAKNKLSILWSKLSTLTFCDARSCPDTRLDLWPVRRPGGRNRDASYQLTCLPGVRGRIRLKFDENRKFSSSDFGESRPGPSNIDPCWVNSG